MILYSEKPLPIQMKNVMLLDDESTGGVVYVSKATYDQATILWSRFEGNANILMNLLKINTSAMQALPGRFEALLEICGKAPKPLDILGPFVKLFMDNNNLNWTDATLVDYYGWLHQVSQMIDFNAITLVPQEVAAKVDIPSTILKSYKESWNDLTESLKDKVLINGFEINPATALSMKHFQQPTPAGNVSTSMTTPVVTTEPVISESATPEVIEETEDDDIGNQLGDGAFDFASLIDPEFEMPTVGGPSDSDNKSDNSDYGKKAAAMLDEFSDMD